MLFCPRCNAPMDFDENACPQCDHRLQEETVFRAQYEPRDLLELGLSPQFVDFVFLDPKPRAFQNWCEPRQYGWPAFIPDDVTVVYCLWTCNSDVIAAWRREGELEFVRLGHDDPEPQLLATGEQGLLADLFLALLEKPTPPDNLPELAKVAGFRHLGKLENWHQKNGNAADFAKRWRSFLKSLG